MGVSYINVELKICDLGNCFIMFEYRSYIIAHSLVILLELGMDYIHMQYVCKIRQNRTKNSKTIYFEKIRSDQFDQYFTLMFMFSM